MVWRTIRSIFVEKARNYNALGALAGIHVYLSKELQWFGEPQEASLWKKRGIMGTLAGIHVHLSRELQWFGVRKTYARAIEQGITRIGELEVEQKGTDCW